MKNSLLCFRGVCLTTVVASLEIISFASATARGQEAPKADATVAGVAAHANQLRGDERLRLHSSARRSAA